MAFGVAVNMTVGVPVCVTIDMTVGVAVGVTVSFIHATDITIDVERDDMIAI